MITTANIITPREAILHSAKLLNQGNISVRGTVVLVDGELGRVDIAHGGAKLIIRVPSTTTNGDMDARHNMPITGAEIVVKGVLKKEQRRTFLLASSFVPTANASSFRFAVR